MRIHFAAALLCAGALAGCSSTPLTQLQESTPKGTAVSQALAGAYADFAKVEVTGEPERLYSTLVRGITKLPVRLHAR